MDATAFLRLPPQANGDGSSGAEGVDVIVFLGLPPELITTAPPERIESAFRPGGANVNSLGRKPQESPAPHNQSAPEESSSAS